ncbi:calcium-responsive transcription factor-like [Mytilus edulis]|uniref:calcium-responsive transcription factor-like n=1 Tax=Mytilus edulis TaxID=6550 RepID=UPI0039EF0031
MRYKVLPHNGKKRKWQNNSKIPLQIKHLKIRVYVSLPKEEDHACHLIGEMAAYCLPVDRRINRKIVELVDDGIRRVPEVKKLLELFVRDLEVTTTNSNRRFFPTDVDIRNHIYQAIVASRFCKNDQQNLQILVNKWKEDSPKDKFFYQPVGG